MPGKYGELVKKWAVHVSRMIRLDKRDPDRIEEVIKWCQQDDFWQNNILSTEKLRQQFDQLELKMSKKKGGKLDGISEGARLLREAIRKQTEN
jgi:hypothetical protein